MEVLRSLALSCTHDVTASNIFWFGYLLDLYNMDWSWHPELHPAAQVQRQESQRAPLLYNYTLLSLLYRLEKPITFLSHCKWALYSHAQLIIQSGSWVSFLLMASSSSLLGWPWARHAGTMLSGYPGRRVHGHFQANYRNVFWNPLSGNIFSGNCKSWKFVRNKPEVNVKVDEQNSL